MIGRASATVKFKPTVTCNKCNATGASETSTVQTGVVDMSDLQSAIEHAMSRVFIQPPLYWAVSGRGNYTCGDCLEKAAKAARP